MNSCRTRFPGWFGSLVVAMLAASGEASAALYPDAVDDGREIGTGSTTHVETEAAQAAERAVRREIASQRQLATARVVPEPPALLTAYPRLGGPASRGAASWDERFGVTVVRPREGATRESGGVSRT